MGPWDSPEQCSEQCAKELFLKILILLYLRNENEMFFYLFVLELFTTYLSSIPFY